ncbi:alcohol dehydrogenase catalytic domain-containing protein [Aurantivibrio infirmus]
MMQQLVFVSPGNLTWRECLTPTLQNDQQAIVKPIVVGRCDLDSLFVSGQMPLKEGEPIGHEVIAEIVELGELAARHFYIGQRVLVSAQICCGECVMCRRGQTGRCQRVPFAASYGMGREGNFGAALADLMRIPFASAMLVPLPAAADPCAIIGLADMSTDAWRAVGPALQERPKAKVLVLGGMTPVIGIYCAGMAVSLRAELVDYIDEDAERKNLACNYGARVFNHIEESDCRDYDIVVDASGSAAQLLEGLHRTAADAFVISVAPAFVGPEFPMLALYQKGITYKVGRPNCRHGLDGAMLCCASNGFDPSAIYPKIFPFDLAHEAWCDPSVYVAVSRMPRGGT